MYNEEEDVLYSDFHPEPDTEYFLYVGELKTDCLNPFLRDAFTRIFNKKFDFISILPDVMDCYPHRNILVINPRSRELIKRSGCKVNCRITNRHFNRRVSESRTVHTLIQELLKRQNRLFVHVFESVPEMTLNRIPGVTLIGPDGKIAHQWNNKLYQLQALQNTSVPVIDFRVCAGYSELLQITDRLWHEWDRGIFISRPYSAAGMNSFIAFCAKDLAGREMCADSEYFAAKYIPHISDPTVLGVVADADDVFIAAVADQEIEGGNTFKGSVFPSTLPLGIQNELKEHTRTVGRILGQSGYRGIFGCDYIVDEKEKVHFVELNARKQGTTMEMCCTLENLLPADAPSLLELEYYAVTKKRFPANRMELQESLGSICWQTYNYKTDKGIVIQESIFQDHDERELFRQVACHKMEHGVIVMEHLGQGLQAEPGSFVGRIAAVSRRRDLLEADIQAGKELLSKSIKIRDDNES
jgi:hypothetical protein